MWINPGFKKRRMKTRFVRVWKRNGNAIENVIENAIENGISNVIENVIENALKTVALLTSLKTARFFIKKF